MTPFKSATYSSQSVNNLTQDEIDVLDGSIAGLAVANKVLIPDDNVDLSGIVNLTAHCVVANWSALGCSGWNQTASFAHRDLNNQSQFAMLHSAFGEVRINATNSQNISLCINDLIEHLQVRGSTGEVIIGVASEVPSPNALLHLHGDRGHGLSMYADFPIEVAPGTDATCKFGKAEIGYNGVNPAWAAFGYLGNLNGQDYALMAGNSGNVKLNSKTGHSISFRDNDVARMTLSGGDFGIGTETPAEKLDVVGNVKVSGTIEAGLDVDLTCNFGKAAIGYNTANADWACFAHIDNNSGSMYALLQSPLGKTHLNSASGKSIEFLEAAVIKMTLLNGDLGIGTVAPSEKLEVVGNILASGTITPSDDRLKHNEVDIITGLDIIRQLVPQTYDKTTEMRDEDFNGVIDTEFRKESGFIAQEVLAISDLSYCVGGGDYLDSSGNTIVKAYNLNYTNIFTYGIAATKELDAIVSAQAIIIQDLQTRLALLEV
jgi:hypothetical protein